MPSQIPALRSAVVDALKDLFPDSDPTLVSYGAPGANVPDEIVGLKGTRTRIERPTMGTARTREEIVEISVVFSVWTGDTDPSQDQVITERAWAMFSAFADYFKTKPNETLGGACREALVTEYDDGDGAEPTYRQDLDNPSNYIVTGRLIEITAVLTARGRI